MRVLALFLVCAFVLTACKTTSPPMALSPKPWDQRVAELQHLAAWQLEGRTAVALVTQGWQASLNWRQRDLSAEVHLAGPLGVGAVVLNRSPAGLSMNGAPPSDAVVSQLQERLGFELPLDNLRFWLLGVPDPALPFELARSGQDRAQHLLQGGWSVDYDRYLAVGGDLLPAHLVLSRADVKVKIIIDHWEVHP